MKPIGFIGLGLLGQAIALRLSHQGLRLVTWNREPERCEPLAALGATIAASPREVAERCDTICLCVLDAKAVRAVCFGDNGIAVASPRARAVVDFSTVEPEATLAIAAEAAARGVSWIDAPVSGGPPLALAGELTVMAGGDSADIEAARPLWTALAANFTHVGPLGSGQKMKIVNQALVGAGFVMLAEALALARAHGLAAELVPQCLRGGLADSAALQRVWPRMVEGAFEPPTGLAGQMLKDLRSVDSARAQVDLKLPLIETAVTQYALLVERFGERCETVAVSRLYPEAPPAAAEPMKKPDGG